MSKPKFDITMPIMGAVVGLGLFAVYRLTKTKSDNQIPIQPQTDIKIP